MPETKASPLDRVIFESAGRAYSVSEVLDWAFVRGELDPHWKKLLAGVAGERLAAEQELEFEQDDLNSAAETFRYAHDLITAEETERWLEERTVTLGDFASFHARNHWRTHFGDKTKGDATSYLGAPVELREAQVVDLIFSDDVDRIAAAMSWRIAAAASPLPTEIDSAMLETIRADFFKRAKIAPSENAQVAESLGRGVEWLNEQFAMEARYRTIAEQLLTPQARDRELNSIRLPLTRFDLETIELDSQDAAREAMFCVKEDGMSMEEVAQEGRYPYRRATISLEDIAEELQQRFLNVRPGTLIDPIPRGDGIELCRVVDKTEPDPKDDAVRHRIDRRILNRHFDELTAKQISWSLIRPES